MHSCSVIDDEFKPKNVTLTAGEQAIKRYEHVDDAGYIYGGAKSISSSL